MLIFFTIEVKNAQINSLNMSLVIIVFLPRQVAVNIWRITCGLASLQLKFETS